MARENKKVIIIQNALVHYRIPFYNALRERLFDEDIDLRLLYGLPVSPHEVTEKLIADLDLPWGEAFTNHYLPFRAIWHPVLNQVWDADLVIVEHASRLLVNYAVYLSGFFGGPKMAFWGHGWGHQTDRQDRLSEKAKTWIGKRGEWYFAYTWKVREGLIHRGYDGSRITDVQNAVAAPTARPSHSEIETIRKEHGLTPDCRVALCCGAMYGAGLRRHGGREMYHDKRLGLAIVAAEEVRRVVPSFVLILAGAGRDEGIAIEAARKHDFIRFVGPIFGSRKAAFFAISRFVVMPGLVGLGLIDAFHHGVPAVVTEYRYHSPEIVYLRDGENGIMAEDSREGLTQAMIRLATDDVLHAKLVTGCKTAAEKITIEEMVSRFTAGILAALEPQHPTC